MRQITLVNSLGPDVVDHIRGHYWRMFATDESETHWRVVQLELAIGYDNHAVANHASSFTVESNREVIDRLGFGLPGEQAFQSTQQGWLHWNSDSIWKSLHGIAP